MGSSQVLLYNSRLFVIELDYGYQYLLEVYSELSNLYFVIWLRYHSMLALCDRPVLVMVNILALELWQLLQYLYICSNVDVVSRLVKCCWMSPFHTVCKGSLQVVIALFSAIVILHVRLGGRRVINCCDGLTVISVSHLHSSPLY